ncbi:hypothetical protein BH23VER1_BH23VER1_32630 [soil metagenome]
MNNLLIQQPPAPVPARRTARKSMLLHCGAKPASREEVFTTRTPESTPTWYPLPHRHLINEVEGQLRAAGFLLEDEAHALTHDGARYFGAFQVGLPGRPPADYGWVVGLRNSHDKSYPAGLVAGTRVLVCDNLSFTGEVRISRKHTRFAARDVRHLTARAVGQLGERFRKLDERVLAYRGRGLTDPKAHDLIVKAIDCRAITPTQVPAILGQWREPSHDEFRPRTAWSLFNAITEGNKGISPNAMIARSQALHGLFDGAVGLAN